MGGLTGPQEMSVPVSVQGVFPREGNSTSLRLSRSESCWATVLGDTTF